MQSEFRIRTDGFVAERIAACVAVLAIHVALAWCMLRPVTPAIPDQSRALQVHWIERVVPKAHWLPQDPSAPLPQAKAAPSGAQISKVKSASADTLTDSNPFGSADTKGKPMSAVFLEQGRRWAKEQAPAFDFQRDPLAARQDLVAINKSDQFRMREPMSVARVASGIGTLFGGPDYTTDPCPRIRANLASVNTGGDRALVDEEVRRLKRLCQ